MKVAQIQFSPWDKIYDFDINNLELSRGDNVIVKTDIGTEIGKVVDFKEFTSEEVKQNNEIKPIVRKANLSDLEKSKKKNEDKKEALQYCKKMVSKHKMPMKLVDVHFSFDDSRITFAFIADGRVDFRELVKDLTRHFNRTIRLHQIGIRDEAKLRGDVGHCGRGLCCRGFLRELSSVTSEMADLQQVSHRGSERISGVCGRLMCCLGYEEKFYNELASKLPPIESEVKVDSKKGKVVGWHVLKQSIDVEFSGENGNGASVVEVDWKDKK